MPRDRCIWPAVTFKVIWSVQPNRRTAHVTVKTLVDSKARKILITNGSTSVPGTSHMYLEARSVSAVHGFALDSIARLTGYQVVAQVTTIVRERGLFTRLQILEGSTKHNRVVQR